MAYATHTQSYGFALIARVQHLIEEFKENRVLRAQYYTTLAELRQLDDRDLVDLGLSRYDFEDIARTHVYGA